MSIKKRVENKEKGHSLDNMICETIVLLRNRLQLSKADFAKRIGYSLAHLRRVEKGESLPTMEMIESIIKEFQLNPICVDSIAIFGISSIPIFRIEKEMVFPPFVKRYFLNVIEFSGLSVTG